MKDASLFCEIIESDSRVSFLRQIVSGDYIFRIYQGCNGKVTIDFDDENFTDELGEIYLEQLGLWDLIKQVYPAKNDSDVENVCQECNGKGMILFEGEYLQCGACVTAS